MAIGLLWVIDEGAQHCDACDVHQAPGEVPQFELSAGKPSLRKERVTGSGVGEWEAGLD